MEDSLQKETYIWCIMRAFEESVWNFAPEDQNVSHRFTLISTSSTREEVRNSYISWFSVWLELNHAYPRSSSAGDCPAGLYSNQQWERNRFVNFPRGFLCLKDLVVESGWIRFAETKDPILLGSLIERDCLRVTFWGQCQATNKSAHSLITWALSLISRINTDLRCASVLSSVLERSQLLEGIETL